MSLSSLVNVMTFTNVASTSLPFSLPFHAAGELECWLVDGSASTQLTSGTHYTVETKSDYSGGATVTLTDAGYALAQGKNVEVRRMVALSQELTLPNAGKLPSSSLEAALDRLAMALQQSQEQLDRCLHVPVGVSFDANAIYASFCRLVNGIDGWLATIADNEAAAEAAKTEARACRITSIQKTATAGLADTYTIQYADGSTYGFSVTNGAAGRGISSWAAGTSGTDANGRSYIDYVITFTDNTTQTLRVTDGKDGGGSTVTLDDVPTSGSANAVKSGGVYDYAAKKSVYGDTTINIGRKSGTTTGTNSTAEGKNTTASGDYSHAEGEGTTASGYYSHAEGNSTTASGNASHAEGYATTANGECQHVAGKYNVADTTSARITGGGANSSSRANIEALDWSGNLWVKGLFSNTLGTAIMHSATLPTPSAATLGQTVLYTGETTTALVHGHVYRVEQVDTTVAEHYHAEGANVSDVNGDYFNFGDATTTVNSVVYPVWRQKNKVSDIYQCLARFTVDAGNEWRMGSAQTLALYGYASSGYAYYTLSEEPVGTFLSEREDANYPSPGPTVTHVAAATTTTYELHDITAQADWRALETSTEVYYELTPGKCVQWTPSANGTLSASGGIAGVYAESMLAVVLGDSISVTAGTGVTIHGYMSSSTTNLCRCVWLGTACHVCVLGQHVLREDSMITYTDPNGKTYSELPRIWHGTTPVLESWALENGWTKAEIHHYSKLKLCRALKSAGLWDTVKAAIDASSYADEWSLAQDLASTDAAFSAFMAAMPGVTEEQKTALLAQCEEG